MVTTRRFRRLAMISVVGLLGWTGCGQARAQFGMDYGMFGMGFTGSPDASLGELSQ